ncbi:hypothetical protein D3C84_827710 [compost metagenome]
MKSLGNFIFIDCCRDNKMTNNDISAPAIHPLYRLDKTNKITLNNFRFLLLLPQKNRDNKVIASGFSRVKKYFTAPMSTTIPS